MSEELKIIIAAETKKLRDELDKAQKEVEKLKKSGKQNFSEFNDEFQKAGNVAKKACAVMATALAGAITAILALGASTEEYRVNMAKLEASWKAAGATGEEAKNVYNDLYKVMGESDVAVEAANHIGQLNLTSAENDRLMRGLTGVYATFGDSLPLEGLAEAINHTAQLGEVQGPLADALEWSGITVEDFNAQLAECNSIEERAKLINDTLNASYGESADIYNEATAEIQANREAQAQLQESLAKVGEAVQPINTALTQLGADILAQLEPYITNFAENYLPQITEALSNVGTKIGEVITWVADNWDWISTVATVIAGICVALSVFSTVMGVVNAVMMASPITWIVLAIVAAIALLVAIIVVVIKHWDEIKEATKKCWDAICNAVQTAIDWVINFFNNLINFVKENWQGLLLLIVNPFAGAFKLAYDNCESFRTAVDNFVAKVKDAIGRAFDWIKEKIISPISEAFSTVKETFSNIVSTIGEKLDNAKTKVSEAIEKIKSFFNFTWELPKLKMPRITVSGKFSLNPIDYPKFSISWNKLGGVFDKPTLFSYGGLGNLQGIGEDGAEAVVPLEKNTMWLDRLATMLNEKQGTTPIVLQVDGRTFAEISVNSINQLTKQRGSLALNIV